MVPDASLSAEVAAPDPGRDEGIRTAGRELLNLLYSALRAIKLHRTQTREVRASVGSLQRETSSFLEEYGPLEIHVLRRHLYLNSVKLSSDIASYAAFEHVVDVLQRAGVGVLRVEAPLDTRDWRSLLRQLSRYAGLDRGAGGVDELGRALASRKVTGVSVAPPLDQSTDFSDESERRRVAKRTYEESVAVSKALFEGTRMGRGANVKQVKHAVQSIVDQVLHNEASLGGLSTLKDYDDYTFTHCVNVCIFCVAIGRRLGLSKAQLYDLGLAALVHDLGMSRIPVEILTKGAPLTESEHREMEAHTWLGALSAFKLRDYGEIPYQSMIVAYEHHMNVDLSGYPRPVRDRTPSIFSRIIAVAAAFDAATNTRAYTAARPPDEVLAELWGDKSLGHDPVIVKALINLLGIYPVGTVVILDTYELALVHTSNPDPMHVHRPIVRLLCDPQGTWLDPAPLLDLTDTASDGSFQRTIIKVTNPGKYGINVSDYFV